jgi:hypothetical protein
MFGRKAWKKGLAEESSIKVCNAHEFSLHLLRRLPPSSATLTIAVAILCKMKKACALRRRFGRLRGKHLHREQDVQIVLPYVLSYTLVSSQTKSMTSQDATCHYHLQLVYALIITNGVHGLPRRDMPPFAVGSSTKPEDHVSSLSAPARS